jgi:hypothetical protein
VTRSKGQHLSDADKDKIKECLIDPAYRSLEEIAKDLDMSFGTVYRYSKIFGIPKLRNSKHVGPLAYAYTHKNHDGEQFIGVSISMPRDMLEELNDLVATTEHRNRSICVVEAIDTYLQTQKKART